MYLIDTNILSYYLRQNSEVIDFFEANFDDLKMCSIVEAECFFGVYKNDKQKYQEIYEKLFSFFPSLPFDSKVARKFAKLKFELNSQGIVIEDFDLLIAATALVNNLTLVTNNLKHFKPIPKLKLLNIV